MNKRIFVSAGAALALAATLLAPSKIKADNSICNGAGILLCDTFQGTTFFKDETNSATFFRYVNANNHPDDPTIAKYDNINPDGGLELRITDASTTDNYSDANISTSVINDGTSPYLRFKVNTRAEARIKFDPKMQASAANPGTDKGSSGLLFWDYFKHPESAEDGIISDPNDVLGFTWQDSASTLPGFKALAAINGAFALYQPLENVNLSEYNTYAIERRHDSIKWFINDVQVAELPINQPGWPTLSDDQGLAEDAWVDNASYQYVLGTPISANLPFNHLTEDSAINISYFKITQL